MIAGQRGLAAANPPGQPFRKGSSGAVLVVANWDYLHLPRLAGPRNDIDVVSTAYQAVGFEVVNEASNLRSRQDILNHLHAFGARVTATVKRDGRIGFVGFHFAGHGTSGPSKTEPANFLLSCDAADMTCPETAGVELDEVVAALAVTPGLAIGLIIDACRKVAPSARDVEVLPSLPTGFVQFDPERNLIRTAGETPAWVGYLFSCQHGAVANDTVGNGATPSPLASGLALTLRRALLPTRMGTLFHRVVAPVEAATRTASAPGQRPLPKTAGAPDPRVRRKGGGWLAAVLVCVLAASLFVFGILGTGGTDAVIGNLRPNSPLPTDTSSDGGQFTIPPSFDKENRYATKTFKELFVEINFHASYEDPIIGKKVKFFGLYVPSPLSNTVLTGISTIRVCNDDFCDGLITLRDTETALTILNYKVIYTKLPKQLYTLVGKQIIDKCGNISICLIVLGGSVRHRSVDITTPFPEAFYGKINELSYIEVDKIGFTELGFGGNLALQMHQTVTLFQMLPNGTVQAAVGVLGLFH